jgi:hypothetical protein
MARCSVCSHEKAKDINRLLLTRGHVSAVAREYKLCRGSVWNHFKAHLPWRLQRRPKSVTVREQLEDLKFELLRLQVLGECGESVGGAIAALNARRQVIELEARLEGKLDAHHKKLILNSQQPAGDYRVEFVNGRPRTVEASKE